jgi:hypothetical protein
VQGLMKRKDFVFIPEDEKAKIIPAWGIFESNRFFHWKRGGFWMKNLLWFDYWSFCIILELLFDYYLILFDII